MAKPKDDPPSQLNRILYGHWVGRAREMDEANALLQRAVSGQGQVLLISGEPGVGKTRFVRELITVAGLAQASVLVGECYAEGGPPYAPLAQMIRDTFETSSHTEINLPVETLRDLLPIIPSLRSGLIDISPDQNLDPRAEQQRAYEGFVDFCSTLSLRGPLLLFVDDVHWADTDTLFLLKNLARRGRKLSLLIVMTYRDSELESAPDLNRVLIDLNRERLAVHLKLERLSRQETHSLLAAMFGEEITPDFLDGIFRQTEGNPFFIEEVCKALVEAGQLSFRDGRWHRPAMAEMKIPQTVHSAIQARLQKLPDSTQEALRMAAILGSDFDFETLKHACDLDEETLISALEWAERAQLIAEAPPGKAAKFKFNFVHVLIPTTMRESIIHVRRRRLHLRAAQAIEAVHPGDFEVLAYQYNEAGEVERARQFYVRAGDRAQRMAPAEAARFYRAALDRWKVEEDPAGCAGTMARLGYCLWVIDDTQSSLKYYETAYTLYDQLGNYAQSGEMQRMIGRLYWQQAEREPALQHYHQALAIQEQGPETLELARAIDSIALMYMLDHDNGQAIAWGERALKLAETLGAEDVSVSALNNIGSSLAQSGDFEIGYVKLQESLKQAISAGLLQHASRAYFNLGVMYQRQCRYKQAEDTMKELYTYSIKYYGKTYSYLALWRLMWINWYTGRWDVALSYRSQIVESRDALYMIWKKRLFAMIDLDLGMVNKALGELEDSLPSAIRADEFQTTVPHWGQLARAYAALGQDAKMMEAIDQLLKFVAARSFQSIESIMPLLIACQLTAAQGSPTALEIAHSCVFQLERLAQQFHTEEAEAALAQARGVVSFAEGHPLEAVEQFRQAVSEWEMIERRYDQARALGDWGRALNTMDEPAGARAAYQQASEIIASLAALLDLDQQASFLASSMVQEIHQALAALSHIPLQKKPRQEAGLLTERELEVLKLVAEGLTNARIAERLVLSPLTVNAHLRSIFNKLSVNTRTAAARQAIELGLV
jgi:predicted ATPase/DNA-binding CsgD family transcriptional regulator